MSPVALRTLRSKLGVSRASIAHVVGVSEVTVVRWEDDSGKYTAPHGLQLLILESIERMAQQSLTDTKTTVLRAKVDLAGALSTLLGQHSSNREGRPHG